jgi:SAP domain
MSSWRCVRCRTVYAVGLAACPHCEQPSKEENMAKANPETGATHYLAEGEPMPDDLPPGVRPVGPGAEAAAAEPSETGADVQDTANTGVTPEPGSAAEAPSELPDDEDGPPDYGSYPKTVLADLCRERGLSPTGVKAELAERLATYDAELAAKL